MFVSNEIGMGVLQWRFQFPQVEYNDFDAIVVTDTAGHIIWTSSGFRSMTLYSPKEAVDKKPSFPLEKNSSDKSKQKIRKAIRQLNPISVSLINYRKDGTEYNCHIDIRPLFSHDGQLINFIAFEKEI